MYELRKPVDTPRGCWITQSVIGERSNRVSAFTEKIHVAREFREASGMTMPLSSGGRAPRRRNRKKPPVTRSYDGRTTDTAGTCIAVKKFSSGAIAGDVCNCRLDSAQFVFGYEESITAQFDAAGDVIPGSRRSAQESVPYGRVKGRIFCAARGLLDLAACHALLRIGQPDVRSFFESTLAAR